MVADSSSASAKAEALRVDLGLTMAEDLYATVPSLLQVDRCVPNLQRQQP
jgi:hypothetical protein